MSTRTLQIASDMDVSAEGARVRRTGTYLNAATATWRLLTEAGVELGNGSLSYSLGSNGDYFGVVDAAVTALCVVGELYWIEVTLVEGAYEWTHREQYAACY